MPPSLEQLLDRADAGLVPEAAIPALHELAKGLRQRRTDVGEERWREEATQARVHPIAERLRQDPLTHRARRRPRGYPGDAVALDYMYAGLPSASRQTTTRLGRAIFAWTAGCSAAAVAVRQRRNTLARAIDEVAAMVPRARVLAAGAGHLREARVARAFASGSLGALVAVDGDRECLRVVARDLGERVRTVNASVGDVAAGRVSLGEFDLVYAADLLERLDDGAARALVAALLRAVAPGGRLLLASFVDGFLAHEYMQAFMDWRLECRDEAALRVLVEGASRNAARQARTWLDPTGCLAWLDVNRPRPGS
jgi:SAM-dependent methyltransferase